MATRSYTLPLGKRIPLPTEGAGGTISGVSGEGVQLLIETGGKMRKGNVLQMLDDLKAYITESNWPPA